MLSTVIYRSHICDDVPVSHLEEMVAAASLKNHAMDVTGILLFNGMHFFQLLEGPEESVMSIYGAICQDPRHYNIVELLHDYAPARRFGNVGMELFDLRAYEREEVLQTVLDKGTTRYQLLYQDRALQFFRTFVEAREKDNYFEVPPADSWDFVPDDSEQPRYIQEFDRDAEFNFAFQPIVDPLARDIVSVEALIRTRNGGSPEDYFANFHGEDIYQMDLQSKKVAFAQAGALNLGGTTLSVNLLPMTLVQVPHAVAFLLREISHAGLVPEQVIIEFTELEVISQLDEFTNAVRQLKAAGLRVAIDHFGSGFAGLLVLSQFQPDRIKINRDLIMDVHKSGARQAIIQAILQCCQSLEIEITAVGIEKPEEWMWLESAGIEHFQGFLFARPELGCFPQVAWPEKKSGF